MNAFDDYLKETGEVGFVQEVHHSIIEVAGLPGLHPHEEVIFETGQIGQVLSLGKDVSEVLLLTRDHPAVGVRAVRTDKMASVFVGEAMLGVVCNPLGKPLEGSKAIEKLGESRVIDTQPSNLSNRALVTEAFETGVSIVDLAIPLGKGQRELVIGDHKTGKTHFLLQSALTQVKKGTICIYAAIAKRKADIKIFIEYFSKNDILSQSVIVASSAEDPPALIALTPYTAMTIAEYFRDQGKDVLVILDDLTAHAKFYRELTLLARRFPGRSSYPGDIFYVHSRLLERAGKFKKGSITCLPVAESVMSDFTGYIQTNLMSMTDGHVFFDTSLYNQGRRPAISTALSVTRVGLQTQTPLVRDITRQLTSFLAQYERLKEFIHFGAELTESVKQNLSAGDRILLFFNQSTEEVIPLNINLIILSFLWSGTWKDKTPEEMQISFFKARNAYRNTPAFQKQIDSLITQANSFAELIQIVRQNEKYLEGVMSR